MSVGVVKKSHCHQKCCGCVGCAVVQQASSLVCTSLKCQSDLWLSGGCAVLVVWYQKVVANRSDLLTMYLPTLVLIQGSRAVSQDEACMVTEVSTFVIITQVGCGLKKNKWIKNKQFSYFSRCKYLHAKIACLATVKSCVTIDPVSWWQMFDPV